MENKDNNNYVLTQPKTPIIELWTDRLEFYKDQKKIFIGMFTVGSIGSLACTFYSNIITPHVSSVFDKPASTPILTKFCLSFVTFGMIVLMGSAVYNGTKCLIKESKYKYAIANYEELKQFEKENPNEEVLTNNPLQLETTKKRELKKRVKNVRCHKC